MTITLTIFEACYRTGGYFTPRYIYEYLLSKGIPVRYETVKRVLHRLWKRGLLSKSDRGIYFLDDKGTVNQSSKGTERDNSSPYNPDEISQIYKSKMRKRGQKRGFNPPPRDEPSVIRRVCALLYNHRDKKFTVKEIQKRLSQQLDWRKPLYRTVQSAVRYLRMKGILERDILGLYTLKDPEKALRFLGVRVTPKPPLEGDKGTEVKLPTINIHNPRVPVTIIIPRDKWEDLKSRPINLYFQRVPPRKKDIKGRNWKIIYKGVKLIVSERTRRAVIYPLSKDWLADLAELVGGWVVHELKGKEVVCHGAINKRELEGHIIRTRYLTVVEDHSQYGKDGDEEYHGPEEAVKIAMGLRLTGHFSKEQAAIIADLLYAHTKSLKEEIERIEKQINKVGIYTLEELNDIVKCLNGGNAFELLEVVDRIKSLEESVKEIRKELKTQSQALALILRKEYPEMSEVTGGMYA